MLMLCIYGSFVTLKFISHKFTPYIWLNLHVLSNILNKFPKRITRMYVVYWCSLVSMYLSLIFRSCMQYSEHLEQKTSISFPRVYQ
jgi:hypothetical protein